MGHMESDFQLGAWRVQPQLNSVISDQRTIHLEPKMMGVLICLAQRAGEVVSKEQLVREVWPGTFVTDDVLIRCISELRKAFGDNAGSQTIIETIPKRGYRLLLPMVPVRSGIATEGDLRSGPVDSIAVCPFENAGLTAEMEYLSDGIAESIINSLSRLALVRVVPRTTIFRYSERSANPIRVGREFGTRLVLTGCVSERDGHLIVDAELIDTSRQSQLWAGKFKRKVSETVEVTQGLVFEVSKRLQLNLSNHESTRLRQLPTESREAYHLFLRAMHQANKWTPEGRRKGIEFARQAIEADPTYAAPYAALAYMYGMLGYSGVLAPADAFPQSRAAALRALEIDETDVSAHVWLGLVRLFYDWDWPGAEVEIRTALALGPNDPTSHFAHGVWLLAMGRCEESVQEMKRAIELDPLSSPINAFMIAAYSGARQYEHALEQCRKTLELDPTFIATRAHRAVLLARLGRYDEALEEAQNFYSLTAADLRGKSALGRVYAIAGRFEEARKIAEELESQARPSNLASALPYIYAALGDRDRALYWLEEAYGARVSELVFIGHAPDCDSLRGDPRFEDLLRRIGIPAVPMPDTPDLGSGSTVEQMGKAIEHHDR
jgi:DNA-binding winged helix-turn-helix (wHTH) protein/TolB-like protein/Flp pilus assembly protein TadD